MNLSGISPSTTNQAITGKTQARSKQDSGNSSGPKYLTVRIGDKLYTYICIGKNMKILIGESSVKDEEQSKDQKTANDKKAAATTIDQNKSTHPATFSDPTVATVKSGQKDKTPIAHQPFSLLNDYRMLGFTGEYQKKMREMVKNLEDTAAGNNIK